MTPLEYAGTRSGHLKLMARPVPSWRRAFAQCRCGEVIEVRLADFLRGHVKSCRGTRCRMKNNLKGRVFGRLIVTGVALINNRRQWKYAVRCSCGTHTEVWGKALLSGNTRSCGCLRRENSARSASIQLRGPATGEFMCGVA